MENFLTPEQRKELLCELRSEGRARFSDRIKVILLLDEGKKYKDIAAFLFLDEGTIANYRKRYKEGGINCLVNDDYSGRRSYLNTDEALELQAHLIENLYDNTNDICIYVLKKYKVKFTVTGMTKLLHRLNFTFKKAKGVPGKAKKVDQQKFIEELLKITNEKPLIYFGDATHPTHQTDLSCGWILKGTDKDIYTSAGRKRVNIFGVVSVESQSVVAKFYQTINQESVCDFLYELRAKSNSDEKIYLVLDRGPANRAVSVRDVAQILNIEIIFLPSYSPNLNPAERLWKFFKRKALKNKYFEKFKDFEKGCTDFFRKVGQYKKDLSTLLSYNFNIVGT